MKRHRRFEGDGFGRRFARQGDRFGHGRGQAITINGYGRRSSGRPTDKWNGRRAKRLVDLGEGVREIPLNFMADSLRMRVTIAHGQFPGEKVSSHGRKPEPLTMPKSK